MKTELAFILGQLGYLAGIARENGKGLDIELSQYSAGANIIVKVWPSCAYNTDMKVLFRGEVITEDSQWFTMALEMIEMLKEVIK